MAGGPCRALHSLAATFSRATGTGGFCPFDSVRFHCCHGTRAGGKDFDLVRGCRRSIGFICCGACRSAPEIDASGNHLVDIIHVVVCDHRGLGDDSETSLRHLPTVFSLLGLYVASGCFRYTKGELQGIMVSAITEDAA